VCLKEFTQQQSLTAHIRLKHRIGADEYSDLH